MKEVNVMLFLCSVLLMFFLSECIFSSRFLLMCKFINESLQRGYMSHILVRIALPPQANRYFLPPLGFREEIGVEIYWIFNFWCNYSQNFLYRNCSKMYHCICCILTIFPFFFFLISKVWRTSFLYLSDLSFRVFVKFSTTPAISQSTETHRNVTPFDIKASWFRRAHIIRLFRSFIRSCCRFPERARVLTGPLRNLRASHYDTNARYFVSFSEVHALDISRRRRRRESQLARRYYILSLFVLVS